jgi:hypothetical protein
LKSKSLNNIFTSSHFLLLYQIIRQKSTYSSSIPRGRLPPFRHKKTLLFVVCLQNKDNATALSFFVGNGLETKQRQNKKANRRVRFLGWLG